MTSKRAAFPIDLKRLWVDRTEIAWGVTQFTAHAYEYSFPVGFAWASFCGPGQFRGDSADLLWIETLPSFRRQGVALAIQRAILDYPVVVCRTMNGSHQGGLPWLKAMGYVADRRAGLWLLRQSDFHAENR